MPNKMIGEKHSQIMQVVLTVYVYKDLIKEKKLKRRNLEFKT